MKILIVDDKPANLKLLRVQLEARGHLVAQAHDGVEALEVLDRQPVDAVISDILMPRKDGYRLCRDIRKSQRLCNLPIIIHSATYTLPSDSKLALDVGADKFLNKPCSIGVILAALKEITTQAHAAHCAESPLEVDVLTQYSERLVGKLEERNIELRRANAELKEIRDQLLHLLQHCPAVIYSLKIKGERVHPHLVSESMTPMLGYTAKESCTFGWWLAHIHPEDRERAMASMQEAIAHGVSNSEYRFRHKAGHYVWLEDNRRLVANAEGTPTDMVVVWTNITVRKQSQNQMLRAQRLESIGSLACGVAHDINNAISPVFMATNLMRRELPGETSDYIELIETSAKRCTDMARQLLTFVKGIEGERLLVQPKLLLEELEKLIKVTFPRNIAMRTSCPNDIEATLGDATQLQQVLFNLCINARDAMPDGGTLTLKVENADIAAVSTGTLAESIPGSYIAWSVTDTGTGMSSEILDRIFEPFFSTKGPDKGTGLGLSTAIGIVKSHGGFLQVSSAPGDGSTFTVYLPAIVPSDANILLPSKGEMTFSDIGKAPLGTGDIAKLRKTVVGLLAKSSPAVASPIRANRRSKSRIRKSS